MKHIGQHAIVIGASMGGLLAARALSDFYAVVTVLELHMAARYDAKLATAFLEVANLEAPPTRLLQPAVVMRVIRGNLGRRNGDTEAAPAGAQV